MPRKPAGGGTQARIAKHLSAGDPTDAGDQGNDHAKHRHHEKPVARTGEGQCCPAKHLFCSMLIFL